VRSRPVRYLLSLVITLLLAVVALAAPPTPDDEIYDRVRILLTNDNTVKGGAIEVKVTKGVVELGGTVRLEKQRTKAEKLAKKVKGVQKVVNNLKVAPV
jgi:hyperosmotically inducible periplasmic protein